MVDEDGKPIAGAQVAIMSFRRGDIAKEIEHKRLPLLSLTTDANGIWTLDKFFSGATQVLITAYSDAYAPDAEDLSDSQRLSDFYSGKSKITLLRGERISGVVKDENGKPLAGVSVALRDVPLISPVQKTNQKGEFDFTVAKNAEEIHLSAQKKGYAPISTQMPLRSHPWEIIELSLESRKTRITGIVVDAKEKPLESAKISVRDLDFFSQIDYSDKAGHFSFDNFPNRDIAVSIFCAGFAKELNFELQPGKENKIILKVVKKVSARVIDSETGEAIKNYTVERASFEKNAPVRHISWKGNQKKEADYSEVTRDANGGFQNELQYASREYQFRVSAEGYYPSISQRISNDDKQNELIFRLEKGKTTTLRVVDSEGREVSDATISRSRFEKVESTDPDAMEQSGHPTSWMGYPYIQYENGELSKRNSILYDELQTNADGVFVLPPCKEKYRLVITHPSGWARVYSRELQADKPIQLTPWGKIRGKILIGGKPSDITKIKCVNWVTGTLLNMSNVAIDKDGNFELNYLFPGRVKLIQDHKRLKEVLVEAGRTTEIIFAPEGRPLSGKLLLVESKELDLVQIYREKEENAQISSPVRPDGKKWEE
ncbi:MAG: carboxypeptidase-like regulatory domain-containing protein, partial [Puniceicoccales bacterium]|nr:carboxypeptidase-like regulatory domain-containing protein [Puniceicoccales bacterium]